MKKSKTEKLRLAEAHLTTFKKPSNWVLLFGNVLALSAGIVNAIAVTTMGLMVCNMTGNTSNIGLRTAGWHYGMYGRVDISQSLYLVLSYMLGAFLCGLLIDKNQVRFVGKSLYGTALMGNSVLLIFAALDGYKETAAYLAAIAMGLQNAMCTSHFGAVVRTTHVTGTITDIGSNLGRIVLIVLRKRLQGKELSAIDRADVIVDARRLQVLIPILVSFTLGTYVGAHLSYSMERAAFFVPATLSGTIGLAYVCLRERIKQYIKRLKAERAAEKAHWEIEDGDEDEDSDEDEEDLSDEEEDSDEDCEVGQASHSR
eukprot:TRINITY_DN10279_c0_g2_i1.p1 TRINITY_DN10279_c0_g2~~TRINITY_DN10279_c0_g2_i1.p1  ORF type:complete len:314 (-),score=59.07 TRINITY_DN10279_c0_g2_i1:120-1061(-)